jgi:hypothetical protein
MRSKYEMEEYRHVMTTYVDAEAAKRNISTRDAKRLLAYFIREFEEERRFFSDTETLLDFLSRGDHSRNTGR